MPSRNPASDEPDDFRMPDLPDDFFDDEDDEFYRQQQRRSQRRQHNDEEWEDARPAPRERTKRPRRREVDEVTEQRPIRDRDKARPRDMDDDDYELSKYHVDVASSETTEYEDRAMQLPSKRRSSEGRPRRRRRPVGQSRQDTVIERPRMQAEAAMVDVVTSVRPAANPRPAQRRRRRGAAWSWKPIVMPQPRQMMEQAFPNLLMAVTALVVLMMMPYVPFGFPLWAPLLMLPMLVLYAFSNRLVQPNWSRVALINLATVGAFFPLVMVRQSALRVPFVEWGNGTLVMPVLTTLVVVVVLGALSASSAYLAEVDPEYAGIVFLPAALLVPFFAGATEITSLATALVVLVSIYIASAILTVVASMLPGAYPTLVAPIALALEFLVLPLAGNTPIFPVGAGMSAKLLFFVLLFVAVGLTVFVPILAVWMRKVHRIVIGGHDRRGVGSPA